MDPLFSPLLYLKIGSIILITCRTGEETFRISVTDGHGKHRTGTAEDDSFAQDPKKSRFSTMGDDEKNE